MRKILLPMKQGERDNLRQLIDTCTYCEQSPQKDLIAALRQLSALGLREICDCYAIIGKQLLSEISDDVTAKTK